MNEAEWLACGDPGRMLAWLGDEPGGRRLRLFACACCRRNWPLFGDFPRHQQVVEDLERWADGVEPADGVEAILGRVEGPIASFPVTRALRAAGLPDPLLAANRAACELVFAAAPASDLAGARAAQASILRDIVGNPFQPAVFDPRWRTADVTALARRIYEDRTFDRLPVLADALMDAGCDSDAILDHSRLPAGHARGCWVLDLALGAP
jgi:hypothetical protein